MCKIHVVIKNHQGDFLSENIFEIQTDLTAIERPSYIEYIKDGKNYTFHYTGSTERYDTEEYNGMKIEYGSVSGRIKSVSISSNKILETDVYNILNNINNKIDSLRLKNNTIRFKNNLRLGLKLVLDMQKDFNGR